MTQADRARVLLTVKASPEIGRAHGETVCVAGIRLDGEEPGWIRLFPVQWQWFWHKDHPKYQVIEVDVTPHHKDQRPESFRPALETVTVIDQLKTWPKRLGVLNRLPQRTMCDLVAAKGWGRPSLALVVPREVLDFDWEDHSGKAAHLAKMNKAAQGSLLAQDAPGLEICPYSFRLHYLCQASGCQGHHQSIVDWEISEAWRRWKADYPTDYLERIKDKWLGLVEPDKKPAFYVGNQHQAPQAFLVLGIARGVTALEPLPVDPGPGGGERPGTDDMNPTQPQSTEVPLFEF